MEETKDAAIIKLTMGGTVVCDGKADLWAALREAFRQQHCVRLAQLLDPAVVALALRAAAKGRGRLYVDDRPIGHELMAAADHPVSNLFHILLHRRPFLRAIDDLCGGKLGGGGDSGIGLSGRYYELHPTAGHFHDWHNDLKDSYVVGISINLSPRPFLGGQFQLRDASTKRVYARVDSQIGDCHLFRIHPALEHRVMPLQGTVPRCSYAGWLLGDAKSARQADLSTLSTCGSTSPAE